MWYTEHGAEHDYNIILLYFYNFCRVIICIGTYSGPGGEFHTNTQKQEKTKKIDGKNTNKWIYIVEKLRQKIDWKLKSERKKTVEMINS